MSLLVAIALAAEVDPVEASLSQWVQAECQASAVTVVYTGLGVQVPADATLVWDGLPCRSNPSVRLTVVEHGVPTNRYTVRPRLEILVPAPVARARVEAGQLILVETRQVPLSSLKGEVIEGELLARTTIEAGQPVTSSNARLSPDGRKGESVVLFVQSGSLLIEAPGILQADATYGQPVRVVNEATRTVLTGVLEEPGRVRIL